MVTALHLSARVKDSSFCIHLNLRSTSCLIFKTKEHHLHDALFYQNQPAFMRKIVIRSAYFVISLSYQVLLQVLFFHILFLLLKEPCQYLSGCFRVYCGIISPKNILAKKKCSNNTIPDIFSLNLSSWY